MKKKIVLILSLLVVLAAAISLGLYFYHSSKTIFNQSYVNGNSAGNLYNAGLICEDGDTIFFANPSDEYKLYSMNSDGSNLQKLCNDTASFINADENYIYYIRNNPRTNAAYSFLDIYTDCLCRIKRDGSGKILILDNEPCLYASLSGNYVYYLHFAEDGITTLYRVKIDGTEKEQVSQTPYFTCCAVNQYLYYNGIENDHYIRQLNTTDHSERVLALVNAWKPTVINSSTAFYMDCDNNYQLSKTDLISEESTLITDCRVDCYNLVGDYLYFQRNDSVNGHALCRIRTDGTEFEVLATGIYHEINATSTHLYFRDFNSDIFYRIPFSDPTAMEVFRPGKIND